MPTQRKTLYALIEYPKNLKKRGKPAFIAPLVGAARISKHHCACGHQELYDRSDRSRGERQIGEIERRPEAQANVVGYAASQRAFDRMAERATKKETHERRRRGTQRAGDDQRTGSRRPDAP